MASSTQNSHSSFRLPANFDYKRQSIALPGTKKPGQTATYRHAAYPSLIDFNTKGVTPSLVDIFQTALNRYSTQPCLGYRQPISKNPLKFSSRYTWITYSEVGQRRRKIGSALEYLWEQRRVGGGDLRTVGIWSQNRIEWQIIDLACHAYAKVTVALYDTLGQDSVEYICNHAELSVVFVSANHLPALLTLASRLSYLKVIVCIDELEPSSDAAMLSKAWASNLNIELFTFSEFETMGMNHMRPIKPAYPNQLCTICYTSGTTGDPKGVLVTHGQLAISCITGLGDLRFSTPGRMLSYLPVAHIYGRGLELCMLHHGVSVGYFTGDPLRLLEDAQILQPTFFPAVPRILNKIYQVANAAGNVPGIKGELFRRAVAAKLENFHATGQLTHPVWDRLIFRKVQALIGGKVENMTCGSAPISPDCLSFAKIALACDVYEGIYGMTETTTVSTITITGDNSSTGTIGPPQPCCEVKLVDVPSMGYTSEDKPYPRGEFCSRGVVNTEGYYKDPEATAKLIDEDGWLHSGDIAEIDSCGRFRIIDRMKNIIKLSQGEFVALEKVQNVYSAVPLISQIFVYGKSVHSYLVAVVVLELETLTKIALSACDKTINSNESFAALFSVTKDERVKAALLKELDEYGKKAGLKGFEMVKNLVVTVEPFSMEEGTLTPTLKIKRREAYEKYKRELDALYEAESPSKL